MADSPEAGKDPTLELLAHVLAAVLAPDPLAVATHAGCKVRRGPPLEHLLDRQPSLALEVGFLRLDLRIAGGSLASSNPGGFNIGKVLAEVADARLVQRRPLERDCPGGRDGQSTRGAWLGVEADTQPDLGPIRPRVSEVEELVPAGRDSTEEGAFAALAGLHEPLIGVRGIGVHVLAGDLHVLPLGVRQPRRIGRFPKPTKKPTTRWLSVYFGRHWWTTIFCKWLIYKDSSF
ncbi:hypothetical protein [Piscinibacter sp.]|uniref:hypothetical protein n=1 Tax=Piscinibacter sp. TaxID=1903157 RepID=UPI001DFE6CC6|nr:hypothetical protein [Piscinibacter sp.]MBK7531618.1 hypothetical protein [Piscinibacter sp.]